MNFLPDFSQFSAPIFAFAVIIVSVVIAALVWGYRNRNHPLIQNSLRRVKRDILNENPVLVDVMKSIKPATDNTDEQVRQAVQAVNQLTPLLKSNPTLNVHQKSRISEELNKVVANMKRVSGQIQQINTLKKASSGTHLNQLNQLEFSLQARLEQSLETIQSLSLNLVKLEVNSGSTKTERLLDNLGEINREMEDVSEVQRAIKNLS